MLAKNELMIMKPTKYKCPFHYIGSKAKLLPQILPILDKPNPDWVIDLFAGGFSVGANCKCKKVICNDKNAQLVELIEWLYQGNKEEVLQKIEGEIENRGLSKTNADSYRKLRNDYNKHPTPDLLYLLICFSFNHQIRYNQSGLFNTPFGKNRSSYNLETRQALSHFIDLIQEKDIVFSSSDFTSVTTPAGKGVVFADPPYLISVGSYNDGNRGVVSWDENDEKMLYDYLEELDKNGVNFVLTNFLTSGGRVNHMLQNFSSKFIITKLDSNYLNSNYHKKIEAQQEVLVRNFK